MKERKIDVAFLPREESEALAIFDKLQHKWENSLYDDEFLLLLDKYKEFYPDSEHIDIFAGYFAFYYGDYQIALDFALKAFHKRKINLLVWQLLAQCYDKLGNIAEKNKFLGYRNHIYSLGMDIVIEAANEDEILQNLTMSQSIANYAPLLLNKYICNNGKIERIKAALGGEYLPWSTNADGYPYWIGSYVQQETLNNKGALLDLVKDSEKFFDNCAADYIFDIMRAKTVQNMEFVPPKEGCILPLAGKEETQTAEIIEGDKSYMAILGKWEYSYYRLDKPVKICSEHKFIMGKPIALGHSSKRKKVVLNILADALSWQAVQEQNYKLLPNIMKFFSKGIIFNNHFSVSEYTYPSLPTIETGMYPHRSQLFNEKVNVPLDKHYKTISEQMQAKGYYCVNIMGGGDALYNGAVRGYDRLVLNTYALRAYEGVERTIQHLDAFEDCDQFLFLHIMDTHPWPIKYGQVPIASQTKLSLQDRLWGTERIEASVRLGYAPLYLNANQQGIKNLDRSLGVLFDYLEQHYSEDEYIVQLYSDHGCSVYDECPFIMSDYQTHAAYMIRGANVPNLGMTDEMTSALDIYQVMSKQHGFEAPDYTDGNLPLAMGGSEREYTITNSIFPGQTYKLCIRTKKYQFQLESKEAVDEDGTVDLTGASMYVLERGYEWKQNYNMDVLQYFIRIAKEHTKSFNTWGRNWKVMRRERPSWFD